MSKSQYLIFTIRSPLNWDLHNCYWQFTFFCHLLTIHVFSHFHWQFRLFWRFIADFSHKWPKNWPNLTFVKANDRFCPKIRENEQKPFCFIRESNPRPFSPEHNARSALAIFVEMTDLYILHFAAIYIEMINIWSTYKHNTIYTVSSRHSLTSPSRRGLVLTTWYDRSRIILCCH